jgi:hypothetical protein
MVSSMTKGPITLEDDRVDAAMWFAERTPHGLAGEMSHNLLVGRLGMIEVEIQTESEHVRQMEESQC